MSPSEQAEYMDTAEHRRHRALQNMEAEAMDLMNAYRLSNADETERARILEIARIWRLVVAMTDPMVQQAAE